jgi:hypothetical protein
MTQAALKQLTLRGFDAELERRIRHLAEEEGISLNKAALKLLRRGAGMPSKQSGRYCIANSLDEFIGDWSDEEADAILEAIEPFSEVDEEFWR